MAGILIFYLCFALFQSIPKLLWGLCEEQPVKVMKHEEEKKEKTLHESFFDFERPTIKCPQTVRGFNSFVRGQAQGSNLVYLPCFVCCLHTATSKHKKESLMRCKGSVYATTRISPCFIIAFLGCSYLSPQFQHTFVVSHCFDRVVVLGHFRRVVTSLSTKISLISHAETLSLSSYAVGESRTLYRRRRKG